MQTISLDFLLPHRISVRAVLWIALFASALQLVLGTSLLFSLLVLLFTIISVLAVNSLGGMRTVAGFCVALMALKIVIISQLGKILFLQPADSMLDAPLSTISVLVLGIAGTYVAAVVTKRVQFRKVILKPILDPRMLLAAGIVSYVLGLASNLYVQFFGFDPVTGQINVGGLVGIARQTGIAMPLSVILATGSAILGSSKRSSVNWLVAVTMLTYFLLGVLGATKFGMLDPVLCYALTCIAFGFTFRARHVVALTTFLLLAVFVLFPFSQLGKNVRSEFAKENFDRMINLISSQFSSIGSIEQASTSLYHVSAGRYRFLYYGRPTGFLDRFSLIKFVDGLVDVTIQEGTTGWETIDHGIRMVLPRFIYPEKPIYNTANLLGRRAGYLASDDYTTQVAFGFIAESFSAFSWIGVCIIPFVLMLAFVIVYRKLAGPIANNVWTVFLVDQLQHSFVEGTIASMILRITEGAFIITALYFVVKILGRALVPASTSYRLARAGQTQEKVSQ
jgi:hypothetical protein